MTAQGSSHVRQPLSPPRPLLSPACLCGACWPRQATGGSGSRGDGSAPNTAVPRNSGSRPPCGGPSCPAPVAPVPARGGRCRGKKRGGAEGRGHAGPDAPRGRPDVRSGSGGPFRRGQTGNPRLRAALLQCTWAAARTRDNPVPVFGQGEACQGTSISPERFLAASGRTRGHPMGGTGSGPAPVRATGSRFGKQRPQVQSRGGDWSRSGLPGRGHRAPGAGKPEGWVGCVQLWAGVCGRRRGACLQVCTGAHRLIQVVCMRLHRCAQVSPGSCRWWGCAGVRNASVQSRHVCGVLAAQAEPRAEPCPCRPGVSGRTGPGQAASSGGTGRTARKADKGPEPGSLSRAKRR